MRLARWTTGTLPFVVVALVSAGIAMLAYAVGLAHELELSSVDSRFQIRGEQSPPDDIVAVQIDERTFNELNKTFPFPRSVHGRLVDQLRKAGAGTIAYDVQFTEPTEPSEDNALIRAVSKKPGTVLGTTEAEDGRTRIFGGNQVLERIGALPSNTLVQPDTGGVLRRLSFEIDGLKTFPIVAAESNSGEEITESDLGGPHAWIDYYGPPGTIPAVSFSQVLSGKVPAEQLRDKTVVVGASAPSLQDVHPTPFAEDVEMAGPEIQANAIATAERGFPLNSAPLLVDLLLIALLAALPAIASARLGPVPETLAAIGIGGGYLVTAQIAFGAGVIIPVVYPLTALALTAIGCLGVQYMSTAFERQRTRDTFARFVPERVVDQVLARTDEDLRLGGVLIQATILMSDVRGFTTFSESRSPEEVIEVLNRYLSEMSDTIDEEEGTLISYIGDGILAVFGAPIEQPDHADRALRVALAMMRRMEGFNEWMRSNGHGDGFRIGIGLNSGPIMSGQVGSERRLDYTTIGDTVNTAARLEGLTKDVPHQLLVAESTRNLLSEKADELEYVEEFEIRGREQKLRTYAVNEELEGVT
jgi:adenylate cyclase